MSSAKSRIAAYPQPYPQEIVPKCDSPLDRNRKLYDHFHVMSSLRIARCADRKASGRWSGAVLPFGMMHCDGNCSKVDRSRRRQECSSEHAQGLRVRALGVSAYLAPTLVRNIPYIVVEPDREMESPARALAVSAMTLPGFPRQRPVAFNRSLDPRPCTLAGNW